MDMVTMKWEGLEDTRVEVEPGAPKIEVEAGKKFQVREDIAFKLEKLDKKFKFVGELKDLKGKKVKAEKAEKVKEEKAKAEKEKKAKKV